MIILGQTIRWLDLLDISIVSILLYYILLWLRGTRALTLLRGVIFVLIIYICARFMGLYTINWLFEKFAAVLLIMVIILFQPELRRTLERLGRGRLFKGVVFGIRAPAGSFFVRSLVRSVEQLSEDKIGAIIVLERNTGLNEYLESGIRMDALISAELLFSIFQTKSPLHDGAVIIQGDRVLASSCLLPLSESRLLDKRLGTRHRAAVGLSEVSDAIIIVVSETTGTISMAENGYLTRFLTKEMLEEKLFSMHREHKFDFNLPWKRHKRKSPKTT